MDFILPLLLGFFSAFVGLLAPGMLNMTAVRTAIEQGKKAGYLFATGAASVVLIQATIALLFANYISKNLHILDNLRVGAIVVFFLLAIFFFTQARKKFKAEGKVKKGNMFFIGIIMSSINMLAIPFYFGLSTYFTANGTLVMKQPYISLFVIGASLGSLSIFYMYVYFANLISKRAKFIASNINYILSGLFLLLGLVTLLKM